MRLTFVGTRGNIPVRSAVHRMHSALVIESGCGRVLVDCGRDWLGRLARLRPVAILISHAHEDHVGGLRRGAPCPVYATVDAWNVMASRPLAVRGIVPLHHEIAVAGLACEAWPIEHSLLAPAVGYRLSAGDGRIFYVPDVATIPNPAAALHDVDVFVGDGATLHRSLVRRRGAVHIGHASIRTQLEWCAAAGVNQAVFTHCGSGIVRAEVRDVAGTVHALGRQYGVRTSRTRRLEARHPCQTNANLPHRRAARSAD